MTALASERLTLPASGLRRVALVGYSGRDQAAVAAHVAELAAHGVPAPASVPAVWEVPVDLVTQASEVTIDAPTTSGEAEPVLVLGLGTPRLTVGSDHTDRALEKSDMDAAKRGCPKVIGAESWMLPDDAAWDELELTSSVLVDGTWLDYQRAPLSTMLPPSWFLERFDNGEPTLVFCGTVPTLSGLVTDAAAFRAQLSSPTGLALTCEYAVTGG